MSEEIFSLKNSSKENHECSNVMCEKVFNVQHLNNSNLSGQELEEEISRLQMELQEEKETLMMLEKKLSARSGWK